MKKISLLLTWATALALTLSCVEKEGPEIDSLTTYEFDLKVSPEEATCDFDGTVSFTASLTTRTFKDDKLTKTEKKDVTETADWSPVNADYLASEGAGVFRGIAPGQSGIKASLKCFDGSVVSSSATVYVNDRPADPGTPDEPETPGDSPAISIATADGADNCTFVLYDSPAAEPVVLELVITTENLDAAEDNGGVTLEVTTEIKGIAFDAEVKPTDKEGTLRGIVTIRPTGGLNLVYNYMRVRAVCGKTFSNAVTATAEPARISVSTNKIDFSKDAGTGEFTVIGNVPFTVTPDAMFKSFGRITTEGNKVSVYVNSNSGLHPVEGGIVVTDAQGYLEPVTVTVEQAGTDGSRYTDSLALVKLYHELGLYDHVDYNKELNPFKDIAIKDYRVENGLEGYEDVLREPWLSDKPIDTWEGVYTTNRGSYNYNHRWEWGNRDRYNFEGVESYHIESSFPVPETKQGHWSELPDPQARVTCLHIDIRLARVYTEAFGDKNWCDWPWVPQELPAETLSQLTHLEVLTLRIRHAPQDVQTALAPLSKLKYLKVLTIEGAEKPSGVYGGIVPYTDFPDLYGDLTDCPIKKLSVCNGGQLQYFYITGHFKTCRPDWWMNMPVSDRDKRTVCGGFFGPMSRVPYDAFIGISSEQDIRDNIASHIRRAWYDYGTAVWLESEERPKRTVWKEGRFFGYWAWECEDAMREYVREKYNYDCDKYPYPSLKILEDIRYWQSQGFYPWINLNDMSQFHIYEF